MRAGAAKKRSETAAPALGRRYETYGISSTLTSRILRGDDDADEYSR